MRWTTLLSLLLIACAANAVAAQPDLPAPPEGFSWHWNEEIRGAFLKPNGWHVKEEKRNETLALFLTKEDIATEGSFTTGFSVNVVPGVGKKSGGKASDYGRSFVREAIQDKENVLVVLPPVDRGRLKTFGCRIKKDNTIIHYFLIADDETDRLYITFFESPAAEFETAWKKGEVILKKLFFQFK